MLLVDIVSVRVSFRVLVKGFSLILRENHHGVRPDTDLARAGQPIEAILMGLDVRSGVIGEIGAVAI